MKYTHTVVPAVQQTRSLFQQKNIGNSPAVENASPGKFLSYYNSPTATVARLVLPNTASAFSLGIRATTSTLHFHSIICRLSCRRASLGLALDFFSMTNWHQMALFVFCPSDAAMGRRPYVWQALAVRPLRTCPLKGRVYPDRSEWPVAPVL